MDYVNELYAPLRGSSLNTSHEIVLPHEVGREMSTKETIKSSQLVIAEVSQVATGVGIELGWADAFGVRILCVHKTDMKPSGSLQYLTQDFISYNTSADMVGQVTSFVSKL